MTRRPCTLAWLAVLLLAGCGANNQTHHASSFVSELRFAAQQEALTCQAGYVRRIGPRTLREECFKETPAELRSSVRQIADELYTVCHGHSVLLAGSDFVGCAKR